MLFTRREMLRVTSRGVAAMGLAPNALSARGGGDDFRFLVVNDVHYRDERCGQWLEPVVRTMRGHGADFCVLDGDLAEGGTHEQLAAVREIFRGLDIPLFATIGNHDHAEGGDRSAFVEVFPHNLNYWFEHRGWQFVALDTTQGQHVFYTRVPAGTLGWLDHARHSWDKNKPTVLLTHFPLGPGVWCRPLDAPQVLERFRGQNLRAVFNGHWHGFTARRFAHAPIVTNRCCSWWRPNNDRTPEKGYFLCRVRDGEITHEFREIRAA